MWCFSSFRRLLRRDSGLSGSSEDEVVGARSPKLFFLRSLSTENREDESWEKKVKDSEWKKALEMEGIEEEHRAWVENSAFETCIGFMILISTIATGMEIDMQDDFHPAVWIVLENIFCVTWIIEMTAKLYELRRRYFRDPLNYVDLALVVLSVFDAGVMPFLERLKADNLTLFRLIRLIRLLRLVKLLQVLRKFRNLWLMVLGLIESISTLNWVLLMLCLVMYAFAVGLRLAVDCKGLFSDWPECDLYFGTIPKIMYTLVQVLTLESWNVTVGRPLVERQPMLFFILLAFIFLTTFGLLNIIVGVIVENTLNIAQSDQVLQDRRMQRQLLTELKFLKHIFEAADFEGNGTLDRDGFVEICQRHEVKAALLRMEVPAEQPEELFDILDEENQGQISFLQFHESVKKVRGVPTAFDMKNMMVSVSDILRRQSRLQSHHDRTQQIIYAMFGQDPPVRAMPRGLTHYDLEEVANRSMLERKTGVVRQPQLKRGGSMQSLQSMRSLRSMGSVESAFLDSGPMTPPTKGPLRPSQDWFNAKSEEGVGKEDGIGGLPHVTSAYTQSSEPE